MSAAPAQILGLEGGSLEVGARADVIVFDSEKAWTLDAKTLASKSKNTPFDGYELLGQIRTTIINGNIIYQAASE